MFLCCKIVENSNDLFIFVSKEVFQVRGLKTNNPFLELETCSYKAKAWYEKADTDLPISLLS